MRLLRGLGLLAIGVAVAAPAEGAVAQGGAPGLPERPAALLFLRGSDGYDVSLGTFGRDFALEASRERVGALYAAPGRVTAKRLDVRFGDLGRVAVRFDPLGPRGGACEGEGVSFQFGFFRGAIEFEGEQGYTAVDMKAAPGVLLDPHAEQCRSGAGASGDRSRAGASGDRSRAGASVDRSGAGASGTFGPGPLNTYLTAISKRKGTVTSFELARTRGEERIALTAWRQERRGRMEILRQAVTVVGGENAFFASGPGVRPPFAFVEAPKPFSGTALYATGPNGSPAWTGSLAAWMPGLGRVGLTGPEYALGFCRRASGERGCNPLAPVRKPLSLLQGSGSQFHALGDTRLSWSRYLRNSASSAGSTP